MSTVADKLAKKSTRKTSGKQVRLRPVSYTHLRAHET